MKFYSYFDNIIVSHDNLHYFLSKDLNTLQLISKADFNKIKHKKRFGTPVLSTLDIPNPKFNWISEKQHILDEIEYGPKKYSSPGVYVCGDTHNNIDYEKISSWTEKDNLSKDDILIVLGDWAGIIGINNKGRRKDEKLLRKWVRQPFTLLVQLGNHENYKTIENLPIIEKFGGRVYEKRVYKYQSSILEGIIYIMIRGEVYSIFGKTFFSMGGAKTNDPNPDYYWSQELPSEDEKTYALQNLNKYNFSVDFVITHTCPKSVGKSIIEQSKAYGRCISETNRLHFKYEHDPLGTWFQTLLDDYDLQFTRWLFGHWHIDISIGKFSCHYNNPPERILSKEE